MKKLLCILSFLGIIPAILSSCTHSVYGIVDQINIEPYAMFYSSNPISGEMERRDSIYNNDDAIARDSVYWKINTHLTFAANTSVAELLPNAHAFTYDQRLVHINMLQDIFIIALVDYSSEYQKGDTINPLFQFRNENDSVMSLHQIIAFQNDPASPYFENKSISLYLNKGLSDTLDFSFRVIYKYESDIFHFADTNPLTIY